MFRASVSFFVGKAPERDALFSFRKDLKRAPPGSGLKSLAEFRSRGCERVFIIFSRDMCVGENTSRSASASMSLPRGH